MAGGAAVRVSPVGGHVGVVACGEGDTGVTGHVRTGIFSTKLLYCSFEKIQSTKQSTRKKLRN